MSEPTWELLGGGGVQGGPISYKGAWAAGTTYQPGDVVRYGGVDYLAVTTSLGQTPPVAQGVPSAALVRIFDVVVGRGNSGDPAAPAAVIDSNTILGGNIPQTYAHLRLVGIVRGDASGSQLRMKCNNDATVGNYFSAIRMYSSGATPSGDSIAPDANGGTVCADVALSTDAAGRFTSFDAIIPNYVLTTAIKGWTGQDFNMGAVRLMQCSSGWANTASITRLAFALNGGNLIAGSRLTLYGMA